MTDLDYRLVLDAFSDAVVAADASNHIVYVNRAAEQLLGWPKDELLNQPLTMIMPKRLHTAHEAGFRRFVATHRPKIIGKPIRLPALHRSGEEIDIELTLSALRLPSGADLFVASLRDLRGRVELERKLTEQRNVTVLYEVMRVLAETRSIDEASSGILKAIATSLDWDVGIFWRADNGLGRLEAHTIWTRSDVDDFRPFIDASRAAAFDAWDALPGTVWRTLKPMWSTDVARDSRYRRARAALDQGLHGAFLFPVFCSNENYGVLEFLNREPKEPEEDFLRTMATVGFHIGQFIERRQHELDLQKSEEWFATTLRSIGDAVIATDCRGNVEFMNPVAERLTGWRFEEARGRELNEIFRVIDEQSREPVASPVERVIREGVVVMLARDAALISQSGTEVSIEDSGAPILGKDGRLLGVVLVFRDVSGQRRDVERQRFVSEASTVLLSSLDYEQTLSSVTRLAVPHMADWCAIDILAEDGALRRLAVAHVDPDKVRLAQDIHEKYPPDPAAAHGVWKVLRTGQPELVTEIPDSLLRVATRDKEQFRIATELGLRSYIVVPLRARSRILGTFTLVTAETGRRLNEVDLRTAEDLANRAAAAIENARLFRDAQEAIRARDEFLSIASHELRTPLTPLQVQVQTLERHVPEIAKDEATRAWLATRLLKLHRHGERITRLVEEMLDVSRIVAGRLRLEIETVDLVELVKDVAEALGAGGEPQRPSSELRVHVNASVSGQWDPLRVEQVVRNLLSNALKYGGGKPIDVTVDRAATEAVLVVRDRGIGIPPEEQARIFDRFERAISTRQYGGLGLGLYVARQIVEALGGAIHVESSPGKGAKFIVRLPLQGPSRSSSSPESGERSDAESSDTLH